MWDFPLFPERASSVAGRVDAVYQALLGFSALIILVLVVLVVGFSIVYRKGSPHSRAGRPAAAWVELIWAVPLLGIALGLFGWAGALFFDMRTMPATSQNIYVTAKQWMWKFEHSDGRREINELHVPVNETIKLTMSSEDVIHSFFVPAFRVKMDVRPGAYSEAWFTPTRVGEYHLFCAEFCGTEHSQMRGRVVVMSPDEYQQWLGDPAAANARQGEADLAGEALLDRLNCLTCHEPGGAIQGPPLHGVFGSRVLLADGSTIVADEQYVRESLLDPNAKIVAGYAPLMPTYRGQVSESQIARLIEHLKKLSERGPSEPVRSGQSPATTGEVPPAQVDAAATPGEGGEP